MAPRSNFLDNLDLFQNMGFGVIGLDRKIFVLSLSIPLLFKISIIEQRPLGIKITVFFLINLEISR